jgi:chemosensory pili system protein ChpA (sensor histidine kinase/response regulator)
VQGEIDQALTRSLDSLAAFRNAPDDPTTLKHARMHVHQAAGAIQMVGLDAVVAYTDEIERHLARLEEVSPDEIGPTCQAVDRACRKLAIFLADLANGAPPIPLKLYPEYEALQRSRGVRAVTPTDLFFPDLSPRAPKFAPREIVPPNKLPSYLVKQRRLYQRGLLAWLRGDGKGSTSMRDAIAGIEDATTQGNLRSFWWTVGALFEALTEHGLESSFGVKQLAARIDLQIRRVVEGSAKAADRLRREVLYYVAISAPVGPQVQAVQRAFRLSGLIPSAESINADVVGMQPLVREAREQLAGVKDTWLKFASGRAENLGKLKQTLSSVHTKAAEMKHGALMKLTAALVERLDRMPSGSISEPLAMEYATALLLAENAFENYTNLAPEFTQQVDAMLARLDAVRAGRLPAGGGAAALDEMSKRAQERVLLAQVGREIQANLRHMEQVLDAFFRDNSKRADLVSLTKDSAQIGGALRILGLEDADRLLSLCQEQIDAYANPETPVNNDDLELLAESLSGLGFYVEAVEQQRPDRDRLIAPLLAKRLGEAPAQPVEEAESVESAVAALRAELPKLVEAAHHESADPAVREDLKRKLAGLKDDAELIGDKDLVAQADAAIQELASGGSALAAAVDAIAETAAPAPEISEETQRLLEVDAGAFDVELLDIYLEEAGDVLDGIALHHALLTRNPGDREALRTVRRGFHTLKGSGRMVGLTELGEIAYEAEKIHNRLLEEERPVTGAVLAMIETAEASFRGWVNALRTTRRVVTDPSALHAAIRQVESELPGTSSVIGSHGAAAPAPPAVPPIALVPLPSVTPMEADLSDADETPVDEAMTPAASASTPKIEVIEFPELGFGTGEAPRVVVEDHETIDFSDLRPPEAPAPVLKLVADNTRPASTQHAAPDLFVLPPRGEPGEVISGIVEADETTIGDVTLSTSLYRILIDEAEQHLSTLEHDLGVLQFDSHVGPSAAMIRASHTLCGIHRTGGFDLVAATAKSLELALIALDQRGVPLPGSALPMLARAVAGLRMLVGRIERKAPFTAHDTNEAREIQAELDQLRAEATAEGEVDAETAAAHAAAREDDQTQGKPESVESPAVRGPAAEEPALHAPAPRPDESLAGVHDEVDEQVLSIFLEEAAELFPAAGEQLRTWRRAPRDGASAQQLRRTLHTFKGSARMAGAMRLGELTHVMESRLVAGDGLAQTTPELFEALDTDLDRIAYVLDKLRQGEVNVPLPWVSREQAIEEAPSVPVAPAAASVPIPPAAERPAVVPLPPSVAPAVAAETAPAVPAGGGLAAAAMATRGDATEAEAGPRAMLRVRADTIDRLVNEAGEVTITRARIEGELRALKANLLELTSSVIRLRNQVREIEIQGESQIQSRMTQVQAQQGDYDPLELDRFTRFQELTRSLAEGVNDVSTVQQSLLRNLDDVDAALLAQARLTRDVQQQLFAIRTVPFGSLSERLYRIVRATAKELGKRANLEIVGGQTELDRSVLEKLAGPLEHLLRNAIDHGIESRDARRSAGKPETGEISLTVRQAGNEIAIELADDGAGIDLARIGDKARALGLLAADAQATDAQLLGFVFRPGFSTATRLTQISGRGVGMDVVRSEIAALGGRVEVTSGAGRGTTFTLTLPLTLAVAQAVLVRAGGRLWALPSPMIEQVQQIKADSLLKLYVQRAVEWQGRSYPFHYLPRLLGDLAHNPETARYNPVLLLRSGPAHAAIHVDEMIGNQEIVVKNIGPQLARVSGISGATVLGSGEIVLIINPVQLAQRADIQAFDPTAEGKAVRAAVPVAAAEGPPLVMVVDDSLTVRKITGRLLLREGYKVTTAKDGVDALQVLSEQPPDVILLDIEMPRMDGFEFAKTIKSDPKTSHIPIIMITSRTAEKHRARATELGVDLYFGKPFQEEELLRSLRELLGVAQTG